MKPVAIMSSPGTGRSTLVRETIYNSMYTYCTGCFVEHMGCSFRMDAEVFKEIMERNIQVDIEQCEKEMFPDSDSDRPMSAIPVPGEQVEVEEEDEDSNSLKTEKTVKQSKRVKHKLVPMKPIGEGQKILFYIEDLHLSSYDKFSDNSTAETLRDLIETKTWFSSKKR